jgi:hypothetical protein
LHPHERVHLHSKGLLDAQGHIPRKVSLAVKQAGQRRPRNLKRYSRRRYREAYAIVDAALQLTAQEKVAAAFPRQVAK